MAGLNLNLGLGFARGVAGSAPPAYNPSTDLAGYQFSIDPSVIGTLYTDTAGTVPVTAPGDLVACVRDPYTNAIVATQATSANRPIYQVDGNGAAYLQMGDGVTARWLIGVSHTYATSGFDRVAFAAGVFATGTTNGTFFHTTGGSAVGAFILQAPEAAASWAIRTRITGGLEGNRSSTNTASTKWLMAGYCNNAADVLRLRRNKTQVGELLTDRGTGTYANGQVIIGASAAAGTNPFNGRLYSLVLALSATTDYVDGDITPVEDFLDAKLNP